MTAYDAIASEYYRPDLHPTCAAFRIASLDLLNEFLKSKDWSETHVIEVGSGRSVFCDLPFIQVGSLTVTDESSGMLEHSEACLGDNAFYIKCQVDSLDVSERTVGLMIASLGDPYNTIGFWSEVSRVLAVGGEILFTTPSMEWVRLYRQRVQDPVHSAIFTLVSGEQVETPSFVYPPSDQIRMAERAGLRLVEIASIKTKDLPEQAISAAPKLWQLAANDPVVVLYRFAR